MNRIKFQAAITGRKYGYVYVLSYPGSDKLKIGHSLDPFDRAEDIGGTKAPENPVVEAFFWCSERREDVERAAHKLQRESRHNGEWFNITVEQAMASIRDASVQVNVEVQLVYDRDDIYKKATNKLDLDYQVQLEAENLSLARVAGQKALAQLASVYKVK
jgi:hypothetical protein